RFEILYGNASAFSEGLRHATVGFMNQLAHRYGWPQPWSSQRLRHDLLSFRLDVPEAIAKTWRR
ncbi:MAG: hypothetical protein MJE66_25775, partial [Proteobacteria bacterium]|nr:hypothetical protein [Pseudomonadota bacterium]